MKKHLHIFIYIIVVASILIGCFEEETPKIIVAPSETPDNNKIRTAIPTGTYPPNPVETEIDLVETPTKTFITEEPTEKFPHLVVSVSTSDKNDSSCVKGQTTEIYYVGTDNNVQLLLSDPEKNFNHPSWSPSGNMIAFIESSFDLFDNQESGEVGGYDSVWIMDMITSERYRVSDYIPNLYQKHDFGCRPLNLIINRPRWSPDGQYLLYDFFDSYTGQSQHYLIELDTMKTIILPIEQSMIIPTWQPNKNSFITVEDSNIRVFEVISIDNITQKVVEFPIEMQSYDQPEWVVFGYSLNMELFVEFLDESSIIGSFYLVSQRSRYLSTWKLNLDTGEWKIIFPDDRWGGPITGNDFSIACGGGSMYFLKNEDWEIIKSVESTSQWKSRCTRVDMLQSTLGEDLVSYVDYDQDKILVDNFSNAPASTVFSTANILNSNLPKYIVNYSWNKK